MRFISIIKPGIIFGNIITLSGGFFLGTREHLHWGLLFLSILGMSLVMASGCVFNNCIDRDIDGIMERTKKRVLVQGLMQLNTALIYASLLGILGFLILIIFTNFLTAFFAFLGLFFYVIIYSLYAKRHSRFCTEVGAIAGAMPPVVGYCAASGHFDIGAFIVFLILFFWQIPHSLAISIYRLEDYQTARLPVMPIQQGIRATQISMLIYVLIFFITSLFPVILGYTGKVYLIVALLLGLFWLVFAALGIIKNDPPKTWARRMFLISILNITALSLLMIN